MTVPDDRITASALPLREDADYVLYWMIAQRRTRYNFALQRAVEHAQALRLPLLVLEPLRVGYRWASLRHHRFILDGMEDNARALSDAGVTCYTYVEPEPGAGSGLLEALAERAAVVVTDHFPAFFLPRMVRAAESRIDVRLERVDSNGLLPLSAAERVFTTAYSFRRHLHKTLRPHLERFPQAEPLQDYDGPRVTIPRALLERWPAASSALMEQGWKRLPVDTSVGATSMRGGSEAAKKRLERFIAKRLGRYDDERNHPDAHAASGLSPYLHYGHVSTHAILEAVFERESWEVSRLSHKPTGKRAGWWGMSANGEAFVDELVTWRELGFVFCERQPHYDRYETLPDWARKTLDEHRDDPRETIYSLEELAAAATSDPVWNAAQRQLREDGIIQNYLRMLWGKRVLAWSESPEAALETLIELNNRYALDGRDPNSYSGIFWVFGRFDRAWGPERPIYGKVRYMTSRSTRRKLKLSRYLEQYGTDRHAA